MDRALTILDTAALLQQAEEALGALRADIDALERRLQEHEAVDAPEFRRWHGVACADLLLTKSELEEELRRLQQRLAQVHAWRELTGCSEGEAFFWINAAERDEKALPTRIRHLWERLNFSESASDGRKRWTVVGDEFSPASGEGAPDSCRADLDEPDWAWRDGREDDAAVAGGGDGEPGEEEGAPAGADETGQERTRVKALYRRIVRRLHPDVAGSWSASEEKLWHRAQAAYAEGDVAALELVLARCDRVGTKGLCLSERLALVKEARHRQGLLRVELARLASGPAWRFSRCGPDHREALREGVRGQLRQVLSLLTLERQVLSARLDWMNSLAERWRCWSLGDPGQLEVLEATEP